MARLPRLPRTPVSTPKDRQARSTRLRPALREAVPAGDGAAGAAALPLATLLAGSTSLAEILPQLHQHVLVASTGVSSLLFQYHARTGAMQPVSGYGFDAAPIHPWMPAPPEARFVARALSRPSPTFVRDANRRMPELSARLGTPAALLLPLVQNAE